MNENQSIDARRRKRILVACAAVAVMVAATASLTVGAGSTGPDVTVFSLPAAFNWGSSGGVRGYSIGTTSCNIGDAPLNWCDNGGGCGAGTTDEDHPAIAQNLYRLKDGRFEQLGMSWLKHGFVSLNTSSAGCGDGSCDPPPLGGNQLGVGCTDPYGSSKNGGRPLGRRSEVNATTGEFPFPYGTGGTESAPGDQRVKVLESELDPALNAGARYFLEGQYVAPDDAAAGNGLNNASYREVSVQAGSFNLSNVGSTVREVPAIAVWPVIDPTVELVNADTATTPVERFHVARKVTTPSPGTWHYEYAIHNMNSDQGARSFTITFPGATTITNVGFRDVDHHSGEPYATTNWVSTVGANGVSWATDDFATNANANALRWATLFSFWFDANAGPGSVSHALGLFKSGGTLAVSFPLQSVFDDGFETGDTSAWTLIVP